MFRIDLNWSVELSPFLDELDTGRAKGPVKWRWKMVYLRQRPSEARDHRASGRGLVPFRAPMETSFWLRVLGLSVLAWPLAQPFADETAHGFDVERIESEDKLEIPAERAEELSSYLKAYADDPSLLARIEPSLSSTWSVEWFVDRYFDTPQLDLLAHGHGIRHRTRVNLMNQEDRKSGRQLMQIKLNRGNPDEPLNRTEIKFKIEDPGKPKVPDDLHPVIGMIERDQREDFKQRVKEIGIDPYELRPILTLQQERRRVYIKEGDASLMTLSLDFVSADRLYKSVQLVELEPELNEIGYTEAGPVRRAHMEGVREAIMADLQERFPDMRRDLTPKYNKVFNAFAGAIPSSAT
jgi:hypothetical protein